MGVEQEIVKERKYQETRWGTEFDDKNTLNDWVTYIGVYLGQASTMTSAPSQQRKQLVKVATLAVAAIESFDRNNGFPARHYEDRIPQDV